MFIPVLYTMKKSIYKCQILSEWFKNRVNPCATCLNILIQSLYIKKEKFSCYSVKNKQKEYKIVFVLQLQLWKLLCI